MDTKKYEVLLRAVDEGSLLRASERLGYTQSGVTQMMNSLEREIGFPLLLRGNKGVSLTKEGERILPLIRELLKIDERINQECAQIQGLETGSVSIGSFSSFSIHWMPEIIARFTSRHPHIQVEMLEQGGAVELENWLQEGRIDLCFYSLPQNSPFDQIPLLEDTLYAILPSDHPLARAEAFPIKQFANEPYLMYASSNSQERDTVRVLKQAGVKPKISYSSNFDSSIISMAAHKLGISILPSLMLQDMPGSVVAVPLDPPQKRRLGIAVRSLREAAPAVKKFIACAKETILSAQNGKSPACK